MARLPESERRRRQSPNKNTPVNGCFGILTAWILERGSGGRERESKGSLTIRKMGQ